MGQFKTKHQEISSDPHQVEYVMAAQQGKLDQDAAKSKQPKLTKKKTLELIEKQSSLSLEHMATTAAK